ncbi:hypothetical protein Tco_0543559 [Tanacetum coccineum]
MPNVNIPQGNGYSGTSTQAPKKPWGALARLGSEKVLQSPMNTTSPEGHTFGNVLDLEEREECTSWGALKLKQRVKNNLNERGIKHLTPRRKAIQAESDFGVLDDDMEDVEGETVHIATTRVSAASAPVTTVGVAISIVKPRTPPTTTATTFIDEDLTIARTLIKIKEEKTKDKRVAIKDVEDSPRPIKSITTLQPLPTIDPKDKGKGVLVEEELEKPEKLNERITGLAQIEVMQS